MQTVYRRLLALVAIQATVCGVFAGGGDERESDGITTLTVLSTTIVEAPEGTVEQEIADLFMTENPDIRIEFVGIKRNELYSRLTTLATADELPDVFVNTSDFMAQAAEMGIVADAQELFGPEFLNGLNETALEYASLEGRIQYIPHFFIPLGLLYRIDWLNELNMEAPRNWEEFLETAKAMTADSDGDGQMDQWGFAMVGTNNNSGHGRFSTYLRTWGVQELYESSPGTWDTQLDTPESVAAYQYFADMKNVSGVVPPGVAQNSYGENIALMASGKTGMMITGPHSIGAVLAQNPELKGKLGSVPIPMGVEHASTTAAQGYMINAGSDNKAAAVKYIEFLMNEDNQARWTEVTGRLAVSKAAAENPVLNSPAFAGFLEAVDYIRDTPTAAYYNEVRDVMGRIYQEMLLDPEADTRALLDAGAQEIRRIIKNNS